MPEKWRSNREWGGRIRRAARAFSASAAVKPISVSWRSMGAPPSATAALACPLQQRSRHDSSARREHVGARQGAPGSELRWCYTTARAQRGHAVRSPSRARVRVQPEPRLQPWSAACIAARGIAARAHPWPSWAMDPDSESGFELHGQLQLQVAVRRRVLRVRMRGLHAQLQLLAQMSISSCMLRGDGRRSPG